jgi:hypothetical protein
MERHFIASKQQSAYRLSVGAEVKHCLSVAIDTVENQIDVRVRVVETVPVYPFYFLSLVHISNIIYKFNNPEEIRLDKDEMKRNETVRYHPASLFNRFPDQPFW